MVIGNAGSVGAYCAIGLAGVSVAIAFIIKGIFTPFTFNSSIIPEAAAAAFNKT
jgi:hypothetical protein